MQNQIIQQAAVIQFRSSKVKENNIMGLLRTIQALTESFSKEVICNIVFIFKVGV